MFQMAPDEEGLPNEGDDFHVTAPSQPFQIMINVFSIAYLISATISKRGLKFCPLGSPSLKKYVPSTVKYDMGILFLEISRRGS